jgi:hypothetical protein
MSSPWRHTHLLVQLPTSTTTLLPPIYTSPPPTLKRHITSHSKRWSAHVSESKNPMRRRKNSKLYLQIRARRKKSELIAFSAFDVMDGRISLPTSPFMSIVVASTLRSPIQMLRFSAPKDLTNSSRFQIDMKTRSPHPTKAKTRMTMTRK